jgi:hypothetical protein
MAIKKKTIRESFVSLLVLGVLTVFTATAYLKEISPASTRCPTVVNPAPSGDRRTSTQVIAEKYGKLPLIFEGSDEPENAPGDGNTLNDIVIAANCKSVQLRAERQGGGNGRVYTITFKVRDSSGNLATAICKVTVPHSQNGNPAIDDGPVYVVTGNCP